MADPIHEFNTSFELVHNGDEPVDVEIQVRARIDPGPADWGPTAEILEAWVVEFKLTDEQIAELDLEDRAAEDYVESFMPDAQRGTKVKLPDGRIWTVDECINEFGSTRRMVRLTCPGLLDSEPGYFPAFKARSTLIPLSLFNAAGWDAENEAVVIEAWLEDEEDDAEAT